MRKRKMTEKEFWQKIKNYGINLNLFQIAFGHKTDEMYYSGIFEDKNGEWNFYKVEDRNLVSVRYKGNKDTAIDYLYNSLLAQIWEHGYNSQYITNNVIQTPKFVVCNFLQKKYSISKSEAENIWNYLMRNFDVLNEVKYFALNNKFVPEDDCYKVQGYSAQNVHNLLGLNIFDSFVYLIELEKDDTNEYLTRLESAKAND